MLVGAPGESGQSFSGEAADEGGDSGWNGGRGGGIATQLASATAALAAILNMTRKWKHVIFGPHARLQSARHRSARRTNGKVSKPSSTPRLSLRVPELVLVWIPLRFDRFLRQPFSSSNHDCKAQAPLLQVIRITSPVSVRAVWLISATQSFLLGLTPVG
jgi:hypothetical protein